MIQSADRHPDPTGPYPQLRRFHRKAKGRKISVVPYFEIPMGSKTIHEPTRNDISCLFRVISWIVLTQEKTTRTSLGHYQNLHAEVSRDEVQVLNRRISVLLG